MYNLDAPQIESNARKIEYNIREKKMLVFLNENLRVYYSKLCMISFIVSSSFNIVGCVTACHFVSLFITISLGIWLITLITKCSITMK